MRLNTFSLLICSLLLIFSPVLASTVKIAPSVLNATYDVILNISISNTELLNISRVSVYIPLEFEFKGEIGTSADVSLVENPTQPNPLIWSNKTAEGIIGAGEIEYFWFKVRPPSAISGTNFTFLVNLTYLNLAEETYEINVSVNDVDAPTFFDLDFSRPNNTKYSPGASYGFQVRWKDNVNISTVIFSSNFNNSINLTVPLFSGSNINGFYVVNFTGLGAGKYWFVWYANDTSGNWNQTSNITYVILPADNIVKAYVNGILSNYTVLENGTSVNITVLANGNICLYKNSSNLVCNKDTLNWIELLDVGIYEFKANVSSDNANYTSNSTGLTFVVKIINPAPKFKDLQVPSSTTYSPGASYTFKITFYSPSYPINNITNVSFIFENQVYYFPINNPQGESYSFTLRDLGAGTYNWKYCANDTQGESNCTSGKLTISQATPKLDIINVQDYLAPINKTIIGVGCPAQLICKLYLNDSELPNKFYELNTDKGGYYIFTFNTSGNANYSAASITKTMTVYPPRQNITTTTITTTTTSTIQQSQQPSSPPQTKSIKDIQANAPTIFEIDNSDFLKVTEVEITAVEDIKNAEVKVEIPLPSEISTNFAMANKVFLTYLKITTNISSEKIANAKIRFRVEKGWVNANNIDPSKIFLYKLVNDNWIQLPTQKITEDSNNIYYESTLNSFSIFVIAGEIKSGFPWHIALIPIVIIIVAIVAYLFLPTPMGSEYDKLKQKWSSGGLGK